MINHHPIEPTWRTNDGRMLVISAMEDTHLLSCVNTIKRKKWRLKMLPWLEAELRGRFALYGCDDENFKWFERD